MSLYLKSAIRVVLFLLLFLLLSAVLLEDSYIESIKKDEQVYTQGINTVVSEHVFRLGVNQSEQLAYWQSVFGYQLSLVPIAQLNLHDALLQQLLSQNELLDVESGWTYDQLFAYFYHQPCACVLVMQKRLRENELGVNLLLLLLLWSVVTVVVLYYIYRQKYHAKRLAKIYQAYSEGDLSVRANEKFPEPYNVLATTFNDLANQVQGLMLAQQELFQAVSHELRTPLARIRFALDMSRELHETKALRAQITDMDQDLDELDELVNELLYFVSLRSHGPVPNVTQVNLNTLISACVTKQQALFPTCEFIVGGDEVQSIETDSKLLTRMLDNLLNNAGKYGQGVVKVSIKHCAESVVLTIEDNGPGIDEKQKLDVFKPFVRLDKSRSAVGFGLGLSIVAAISVQLNLQLSIESSSLGGASFVLRFPLTH